MPRRVSLPGAAELFRPTRDEPTDATPVEEPRSSTGRIRHAEKITVYVSTDELIALEQTRLRLRADHDTAVDRGRIVREAVSMALEDFATLGGESPLAQRLTRS